MYYVCLPVISLIYIISFIIFYFSKKRIDLFENKYVIVMMIVNLFGLILELGCYAVLGLFNNQDSFLGMFILKTYIVYILVFNWLLNAYIFYLTSSKRYDEGFNKKRYFFRLLQFTFPLLLLLISITYFAPLYYFAEFPRYYTYGFATYSIVFCFLFLLPLWLIKCVISLCRKNVKSYQSYIILFVILMCAISGVASKFIDPSVQIVTTVHSFVLIIIFLNIENPDVAMMKQLDFARNQADKANSAKTDFLSSMSHEIRTPLNAISGFSDCILECNSLDEAKENAKDIVDASNTLIEIVNGILDVSKIEAGKLEIINSSYKTKEVFGELAMLVTPKMKEKGLDFSYYIAPDIPEVLYGDCANIKKVVTNLLSNSYKYTEKGFVRYEVNCVKIKNYTRLIISVEDSGRGIKKESMDKMFSKFQRLEEDKNTTIEGTGLGLAITKQLIELMGGKIIVHSIYGKGSKFTVVINQKISEEEIEENRKYKTTLDLHNVKILLVDDNLLNIKVAKKILESFNANMITTCDSGFKCLDLINDGKKFDIILLDDMMPKMSGVETLKKLKSMSGFNIPIVALTANAITGMREKYLQDGFDNYISKPIVKTDLIKVMNEVLGRVITEQLPIVNERDVYEIKEDNKDIIPVDDHIEEELGKKLDLSFVPEKKIVDENNIHTGNLNEEKNDVNYLKENGADINHALELLGDMEMYNDTIDAFLEESQDRWNRIDEYKNNSDMENYAIEVHSLKSDSKYLGFMDLADICYQHELKSKDNDVNFVINHFSELENEFRRVLEVVRKYNNRKKC